MTLPKMHVPAVLHGDPDTIPGRPPLLRATLSSRSFLDKTRASVPPHVAQALHQFSTGIRHTESSSFLDAVSIMDTTLIISF